MEDLLQGLRRQGADLEVDYTVGVEGTVEAERDRGAVVSPHRQEDSDGPGAEPADGEGEGAGRGWVEPVDVIHGHQHRAGLGGQDQELAHGAGHRPGLEGVARGLGPQEGHLEGLPGRTGQPRDGFVSDFAQQVGEGGVGVMGLGRGGAGGQDLVGTAPGGGHRLLPQGGLAGAGVAADDHAGGRTGGVAYEAPEGGDFRFPPHDRRSSLPAHRPLSGVFGAPYLGYARTETDRMSQE